MTDAEERFERLVAVLSDEPDVQPPQASSRRFGSSALTVHGRIFAMLVSDRFVVKLPAERVRDLVSDGAGEPFHNGAGRPMREWVVVRDDGAWSGLAREALTFVRPR